MQTESKSFDIRGGLDQETTALKIAPGRIIAALNHEMQPNGVQRTEGFERFDGHPAPSAAEFFAADVHLDTSVATHPPVAGETVIGNTSGATARVLETVLVAGVGQIALHLITGTFQLGERLLVVIAGVPTPVLYLDSVPASGDWRESDSALGWLVAAQTYARNLITAVPGSGPVRGVLWFADKLNAWRDNAAATLGVLHHSSAAGWTATGLGTQIRFTLGGPYQPSPGDAIVGDQSGATATIRYVALDDGAWATSDASGILILDNVTGTLGDETISSGTQLAFAKLALSISAVTFPPGGRYDFDIFNFYATSSFERAYGANGVGQAFEFDGSTVAFISTGMIDDRPFLVSEHKNQLLLAFPFGSLQSSIVGTPRSFSGRLGAAELGMGHEITNLIPNTSDVMLVFTEKTMSALTGNDSSDFSLAPLTPSQEAGALAFTAQKIGDVVYLDNRGVRSATAGQVYANFRLSSYTSLINRELHHKRVAGINPVASCVVKTKSQYLLFFDDGSGISIFFGMKQPEPCLFQYPFIVSCSPHVVEVDGVERIFVGATDGFVYELNVGTSFDGDDIEAFIQLPYAHYGSPRLIKRAKALELDVSASMGTELGVITQFDGGSAEQPFAQEDIFTIAGGGGLWGIATWGEFIWSAPQSSRVEWWLDGQGSNMSLIFVSRQSTVPSYTIAGATVAYRGRGNRR
jgi:hypothetical protein